MNDIKTMQKEKKKKGKNRVVIELSIGKEQTTYHIDKKEIVVSTILIKYRKGGNYISY